MREIKKGDKVKIVYGKYVGQTGTVINIEESDENNKSGGRIK